MSDKSSIPIDVLIKAAQVFDEVRVKEWGLACRLYEGPRSVEHVLGWQELSLAKFDILNATHQLMKAKLEAARTKR